MYWRAENAVIVLRRFTFNLSKRFYSFIPRGAAVECPACCTRALQQPELCCRGQACPAVAEP